MSKKSRFTLEQHDKLGLEIQTIRDRLTFIDADIRNHYPKNQKAIKHLKKTRDLLEKFRSEMEELAFKEYTGKTATDLKELYYRATRKDHIRYPQPIHPFS